MEVMGVMVAKQEHNLFGLAFFERDDFFEVFENDEVGQGVAVDIITEEDDFVV